MDDRLWYERIVQSIRDQTLGLPGFPSAYQQKVFVGKSNEAALADAFHFHQLVKAGSYRLRRDSPVLDFGVGWSRILRFILNDVDPSHLHGVDVDPEILEVARSTGVPGNLSLIQPNGRLDYVDERFEVIYVFSVFSRLSEASARFWLPELMRVLKSGGSLVLTTTTDGFLELCEACSYKTSDRNQYEEDYACIFADPADARRRYAAGEHVYAAVVGNSEVLDVSNYGWAAMTQAFVERQIGDLARWIGFQEATLELPQGVSTIRKQAPLPRRVALRLRSLA